MKEKTKNPSFINDVTDYLIANGYSKSKSETSSTLYFGKSNRSVIVSADEIETFLLVNGEAQDYQKFTGASFLHEFDIMLLFQTLGAVSLKEVAHAANEGVDHEQIKY